MHSFQTDLEELQERFTTQFSKWGNAREQIFEAWRSFHFNENAGTIDVYVHRIIQMADILICGEPQILEVLKILGIIPH